MSPAHELARVHRQRIARIAGHIAAGKRVEFVKRQSLFIEWGLQIQLVVKVEGEREDVIFTAHTEAHFARLHEAAKVELRRLKEEKATARVA